VDQPAGTRSRVELIGTHLRVEGSIDLGRFTRVSDYVNILSGFFNLQDVVLLSRTGEPTRINFPEFRVRLDEIAIVGQQDPQANPVGSGAWGDTVTPVAAPAPEPPRSSMFEGHGERQTGEDPWGERPAAENPWAERRVGTPEVSSTVFTGRHDRDESDESQIDTERRRLVISTDAHIIYGAAHLHHEASMMAFLDATDPHFIPMTDVRVRWLADRRLAGRFPFVLVQRDHIVGVATDVSGGLSLLRGRGVPVDPWAFEHETPEPHLG